MLFRSYWKDSPADDWYVIGLNYPSLAHSGEGGGYQLGPNQIMGHDENQVTDQTRQELEADFRRIREMGCRVVRMWAFWQGQGLRWREGSIWRVNGIDPDFRRNVADITCIAASQGIKIYWTLFNGGDFVVDENDDREKVCRMRRAFHRMLVDRSEGPYRSPLMRTVLPDFLGAIEGDLDAVFAIDLMNEPDVYWTGSIAGDLQNLYDLEFGSSQFRTAIFASFLSGLPDVAHPTEYLSFLQQCSDLIHEYFDYSDTGVPVSVGFCRMHSIRSSMQELDGFLDFFDYHHYNHYDVGYTGFLPLPAWNDINDHKPCILGECGLGGQLLEGRVPLSAAWRGHPWRAGLLEGLQALISQPPVTLQELFDAQAECVSNVMQGSFERGYAGCLVWEYGKQYTDTGRPSSPYNPRRLRDSALWGDRFYVIWTRPPRWTTDRYHMRTTRNPDISLGAPAYVVPLLVDGNITGRKVVRVMNEIYQEHLRQDRCPPVSYDAPLRH